MIKAASANWHGGGGGADEDDDVRSSVEEVEMGLLANDQHASSSSSSFRESFVDVEGDELDDLGEGEDGLGGVRDEYGEGEGVMMKAAPLTMKDKKAMALLIVLCASLRRFSLVVHPTPPRLRPPSCLLLIFPPADAPLSICIPRVLFLLLDIIQGIPVSSFFRTYTSCVRMHRHGGRSSSFTYHGFPTTFTTSSSA